MSAAHRPGSRECRDIFARLSEYIDGELDVDLCSRLEEHMDDCPPCLAFLESLRRTVGLTRQLPDQELPDELRQQLVEAYQNLAQFRGCSPGETTTRRRSRPSRTPAASPSGWATATGRRTPSCRRACWT